jgi:hypothetical protein
MLLLDSDKFRCVQHSVCGVGEKDAGDGRGRDWMTVTPDPPHEGDKEHEGCEDLINRIQFA